MILLLRVFLILIVAEVGAQTNVVDEQGRKQGFWKSKNGQNIVECTYKNDTLHGGYKEFNKNGVLILEIGYRSGKPHGQYFWYDHRGRLIKTIEFENGQWNGEWKSYLKGKLVAQANFASDILNGDFVTYYENGVVAMKSTFRDGKMVSGELNYDKKGKLLYIKLPTETRDKLGAIVYYNDDGTQKTQTKIVDEYPITQSYFGPATHKKGALDRSNTEKLR